MKEALKPMRKVEDVLLVEEPLTHVQEVLLKCRKLFPETPESKHAASEAKKRESNEYRKLLVSRQHQAVRNNENLAKARAARVDRKPKTVAGSN